MAIRVKAQQRNISFAKGVEDWQFVMNSEVYSRLSEEKVIAEAALRSGIARGSIQAAYAAIAEVISAWATEGHSVSIPGLGTMRFGLKANAVKDVEDVSTSLIKARKVVFTPSRDIKDALADTSIQIQCYDKDGVLIKNVTNNNGTVEDEEEDDPSTGGNTGGGSNTPSGGEDDDDEGGLAG